MANTHEATSHWYPGTVADKRPTAWWYWGRAVYVSRTLLPGAIGRRRCQVIRPPCRRP